MRLPRILFWKRQEGSATVEFVILFPLFMSIFLMGFESGYFMVRNVMLERGVDVAMRDVRLGNGRIPELTQLKQNICEAAVILPDCVNSLQIEMREIDMEGAGVSVMNTNAACIDTRVEDEDQSVYGSYDVGDTNRVVMVRACSVASPMFPTTGIGLGMTQSEAIGDNYAIIAMSVFVTEPGTRATAAEALDTLIEACEADPACDPDDL